MCPVQRRGLYCVVYSSLDHYYSQAMHVWNDYVVSRSRGLYFLPKSSKLAKFS